MAPARPKVKLKELAVPVSPGDNRAVSFTNKQSAYYYTQTHRNCHPEHEWFRGLNIAGRRVFNDYHLTVDGTALDPAMAQVVAFPDALVRTYPNGMTETLRLFDNRDLVEVTLIGASGKVDLRLSGDQVRPEGSENGLDWYVSTNETAPPRESITFPSGTAKTGSSSRLVPLVKLPRSSSSRVRRTQSYGKISDAPGSSTLLMAITICGLTTRSSPRHYAGSR